MKAGSAGTINNTASIVDDLKSPLIINDCIAYQYGDPAIDGKTKRVDCTHHVDLSMIGHGTLFSSFAALSNTLLGAGILGLPGAFAATGWGLGCILLAFFALTSAFGLHLLYYCASHLGIPSSFGGVCEASVPSLSWAVDAAVAIKCFGVATSYLIVVGDGMSVVAVGSALPMAHSAWILVGFCIVTPLAFLRTLAALRFTATFAIFFVAFTTGLVVCYAAIPSLNPCGGDDNDDDGCGTIEAFRANHGTFAKLPIFIFAFTCHQNAFSTLHNELADPTPARANTVVAMSVGLALFMYLGISIGGYFIFGSSVESDVLDGFPQDNLFFSVARTFVSILVCFCYPLQAHPARASILALLRRARKGALRDFSNSSISHFVVTALFLVASLAVALTVSDLGAILAVVGATGSTTITFILPGICYYMLFPEPHLKRTLALCQCALGCCIVPIALYFIFTAQQLNTTAALAPFSTRLE